MPACCSLSWDQECSLQWFAAVLFLGPWGRHSSLNHFSICLNLPEHLWVQKASGTRQVPARLRGGFRPEGGKCASPWRVWRKELHRDGAFGRNPGELRKTARGCCSRSLLRGMVNMKGWSWEPVCGKIRTSILLKSRCPVQNLSTGGVCSKCLRI